MDEELDDIGDVLEIDEMQLDRNWVEQPKLYFRFARLLADARAQLDEKKDGLAVVEAGLARKIRDDPAAYGLIKATDASVKTAIPEQPRYVKYIASLNRLKHKVDILGAMVTALEHRKRALEKLVDLHGQSYFSTPRATSEGGMDSVVKRHIRRKGKSRGTSSD